MSAEVLFRTPDLLVRRGPACGSSIAFVTFSPFSPARTLDGPGFGEAFLASRGFDAVHIISRTNRWFDYPEIEAALAAAAQAVAAFDRVVAYGSSMGGYAAIRFAERLGAEAAIALSPQYALDARSTPFERRFRSERPPSAPRMLEPWHRSASTTPYIFFDSEDLDLLHLRLFQQAYPRTVAVPIPHAGHPVGPYLEETGLLTGAILDIAHGRFEPAPFAAEARRRRALSSQYLYTLARRLGPAHLPAKIELMRRAIAAWDTGAYRCFLAALLERAGDMAGAQEQLRLGKAVLPDHPLPLYAEASFLMRRGRWREAEAVAEALAERWPQNHRFTQILAVARARASAGWRLPPVPAALASGTARRTAWCAWLTLISVIARLRGRGLPAPRWDEHFYGLSRELRLTDEWSSRRRQRRARTKARGR